MSKEPTVLITGANGEVGHGLIDYFSSFDQKPAIVTLDLHPLDETLVPLVTHHYQGNILDTALLNEIEATYRITTIFHLAALLSTSGEKNPNLAHQVNVNGTQQLLEMAVREGTRLGRAVKFLFPSSIAVYGLPDVATKDQIGALTEEDYLTPTTMYGINKLYCENLGRYYTRHYQQLSADRAIGIDFRAVRFPGLISAHTVPSGGTSDYGPEMIHAAAQNMPYDCFVRQNTTLPFMAMPDAIQALIQLAQAPRAALTRQVYNVTSFSLTAADFADIVRNEFDYTNVHFKAHKGRQRIVDTWAAVIDDSAAREDWSWEPIYNIHKTFHEYLFPTIRQRYQVEQV